MNAETEARLERLVDRSLYTRDATYHAQVTLMRQWLEAARMAMEDEGVPDEVAQRVLNRMVFGVPDGGDAYERIEAHNEAVARLSRGRV